MKNQFATPWSLDRGQLRNCKGEALAYIPIYPDGIGGPDDMAIAQLLLAAPELKQALETMMAWAGEQEELVRAAYKWTDEDKRLSDEAFRVAHTAIAHSEGRVYKWVEEDKDA